MLKDLIVNITVLAAVHKLPAFEIVFDDCMDLDTEIQLNEKGFKF